jgi:ABC-type transport system substrate-binding protein
LIEPRRRGTDEPPALEVESVALNWQMAPFNNADAWQALCLAINRDTIARQYAPSPEVASASMLLTPS